MSTAEIIFWGILKGGWWIALAFVVAWFYVRKVKENGADQ